MGARARHRPRCARRSAPSAERAHAQSQLGGARAGGWLRAARCPLALGMAPGLGWALAGITVLAPSPEVVPSTNPELDRGAQSQRCSPGSDRAVLVPLAPAPALRPGCRDFSSSLSGKCVSCSCSYSPVLCNGTAAVPRAIARGSGRVLG